MKDYFLLLYYQKVSLNFAVNQLRISKEARIKSYKSWVYSLKEESPKIYGWRVANSPA